MVTALVSHSQSHPPPSSSRNNSNSNNNNNNNNNNVEVHALVARDALGRTPLHYAAMGGHSVVLIALMQSAANGHEEHGLSLALTFASLSHFLSLFLSQFLSFSLPYFLTYSLSYFLPSSRFLTFSFLRNFLFLTSSLSHFLSFSLPLFLTSFLSHFLSFLLPLFLLTFSFLQNFLSFFIFVRDGL